MVSLTSDVVSPQSKNEKRQSSVSGEPKSKTVLSPGIVGISTQKKSSTITFPSIVRLSSGEKTPVRSSQRKTDKLTEQTKDSVISTPVIGVIKGEQAVTPEAGRKPSILLKQKPTPQSTQKATSQSVSEETPKSATNKRKSVSAFTPTPRKKSSRLAVMKHPFITIRTSDGEDHEVEIKQEKDDDDEYMQNMNGM